MAINLGNLVNTFGIRKAAAPTQLQQAAAAPAMVDNSARFDALKKEELGQVGTAFGKAKEAAGQQLGAAQLEGDRRMQEDLARNANASGGFGGAEQKMRTLATQQNAEQTGMARAGVEAQLGAQQAQAEQGVTSDVAKMQQQDMQFQQTYGLDQEKLGEARRQFDASFGLEQKAQLVNTLTALKTGGFLDKNMDELSNAWAAGLEKLFPGINGVSMLPTPPYQQPKQKYSGPVF